MTTQQTTSVDFRAMARGVRAGSLAVSMEASWLADSGESERAESLSKTAGSLGALANQLEAWRQEQERLRRVTISAAAVLDTLQGLDLHQAGLMGLAESLANTGLREGDIEQVRQHASALEVLREDLALSVPEPLE
ncbi:hypothetical protein [Halomonas icarae]|uniref:Chemotaxis protein n=1 Tax=Halomonas icarae TaxID=2691040 RepID=A0A7X4VVZ8_9GAMM|nr:hypothetical protein [Halomonas icarae]MDR5901038.1 hypothetical protein [Halomonas icarae]NAW11314.1 hypothetical protein [Halomonas icarae]